MQEEPELVVEEWLYYLIVEENAFRQSWALTIAHILWVDYRELLLKHLIHLPVFDLEGTHNVLTSDKQIHNTSHQLSRRVLLRVIADWENIYELHESDKFVMALIRAF